MNKILKTIGAIIIVFMILFLILAALGMNDSKKEEELAKSNINDEISFEGDFSELDISKDWMGEHIIVSGIVDEVDNLSCFLANNNFVIKAYCDDISDDIVEDGEIKIEGVCTYQNSNKIRMRNCQIVDYKKPDISTVIEDDPTVIDENDLSAIEPKQDSVIIDPEWYKSSNLFISKDQDKLELIWYDDRGIDIAINDTTMYHFDSTQYESTSDENVLFICDDGTEFIYYPYADSVELKSGRYQGIYLCSDDIEENVLEDIKKHLTDILGDDILKSVEFKSDGTVQIRVYFERESIVFSTGKLKEAILDTTYMTLKAYYEYVKENENAPYVSVIACFPNDGQENADEDCYMVTCRLTDLDEFDFTSSDNSQIEEYAYACKWLIVIK